MNDVHGSEQWRAIPETDERYFVSDHGRVRGPKKVLSQRPNKGYLMVSFAPVFAGKKVHRLVHRLVLQAFVGAAPEGHEANHINGIKTDNSVQNLEWVTRSENQLHALRMGLATTRRGEEHGMAKLTRKQVMVAKQRYAAGESQRSIARYFGCSQPSISMAVSGVTWK